MAEQMKEVEWDIDTALKEAFTLTDQQFPIVYWDASSSPGSFRYRLTGETENDIATNYYLLLKPIINHCSHLVISIVWCI